MTKEIDYEAARNGKRPVRTQGGDRVRLISDEGDPEFPLVGFIQGQQLPSTWKRSGRSWLDIDKSFDLIQDPEVIEFKKWVCVFPNKWCGFYDTEADADAANISASLADFELLAAPAPFTIRITGDKVEIFGGTE